MIEVQKNSGELQPFSKTKLKKSLEHTCLPQTACKAIANEVTELVSPGTSTKEIFDKTNRLLRRASKLAAAQYSLKRSLFELGPEGHNFESFVARYFNELSFHTLECVSVQGKFVRHEVDVIATKGKKKYFIECKFHNRLGIRNDIKTALYVKARWDDLKDGPGGRTITGYGLASNTTFTKDALIYAKGTGLKLMGVNAPEDKSFLDEIREMGLYPVTSLTKLSKIMKKEILREKIVVAMDLLHHENLLSALGADEKLINDIYDEIYFLTKVSY